MKKSSKIFVIFGVSGSGQDSVIEGLIEKGIKAERVITTTSRKMRSKEKQGKPYYFVSEKEFKGLIENNKMVEWDFHYDAYYGCSYNEIERLNKIGKVIIWKTDMRGALTIKDKFNDAVTIYIKPPSLGVAIDRIRKRKQDSQEVIAKRIDYTRQCLDPGNDRKFDYIVINKERKLDEAVDEVEEIIKKELGR